MTCIPYKFNTLNKYIYAEVIAFYKGKWILSKHKERMTWETQGGHIEKGETPLDTAKRELYEEAGAIDFDIEPLCDYSVYGFLNGVDISGNSQVFIAMVHSFSKLPHQSEMEEVCLFDSLPENMTYLEVANELLPIIIHKLRETE